MHTGGAKFVQYACAYIGVRRHSHGGNPPFEILAMPLSHVMSLMNIHDADSRTFDGHMVRARFGPKYM